MLKLIFVPRWEQGGAFGFIIIFSSQYNIGIWKLGTGNCSDYKFLKYRGGVIYIIFGVYTAEIEREFVSEDVERNGIIQPDGVHEKQPRRRWQGVEGQRAVCIFNGVFEYRVPNRTQLQPNANRQHPRLEGIRHSHANEWVLF